MNSFGNINQFDETIQAQQAFDDVILVADTVDVNHRIIRERNESLHDLHAEITDISEIWSMLGSMIFEQGKNLDITEKRVEDAAVATEKGNINLEKAAEYVKNRLIIIRDMAIVIGGGVLGTTGFLLGPVIGIGTVFGGAAGGGAVVAGIHKVANNRK